MQQELICRQMLSEIYEFRLVDDWLASSGQPTEAQFVKIRDAGFEVIVNLALPTSDNAIQSEGSIVTGLGMTYIHIPVDFTTPRTDDFEAFCGVMDAFPGKKVFVHCAANKRVSAFLYLRRVLKQRADPAAARLDLESVWQPDPVWTRFMADQLKRPQSA
jgi:protein tyrosine phosphatase (PTP) superfamily phosphohydrolase (DUF442 family)